MSYGAVVGPTIDKNLVDFQDVLQECRHDNDLRLKLFKELVEEDTARVLKINERITRVLGGIPLNIVKGVPIETRKANEL